VSSFSTRQPKSVGARGDPAAFEGVSGGDLSRSLPKRDSSQTRSNANASQYGQVCLSVSSSSGKIDPHR